MKLTIFFLTIAFLQVSAKGLSQSITLKVKNAPLAQVFREIEKQTGFVFIYGKAVLDKTSPVNLQVTNAPLNEVLNLCLRNQEISYTIEDNKYIVLKQKSAAAASYILNNEKPSGPPVSGSVFSSDGTPLVGATIVNRNSKESTITNSRGIFSLPFAAGDVLEISYVGYETRVLKITADMLAKSGGSFAITLDPKKSVLDEMVVIAYGTTTLRKSTGAVSSVTAADISKQPVANPLAALPGRVPGAIIAQNNGLPGSAVQVQIRGQGSLSSGTIPLYVIDGVPFTNFNGAAPPTDNLNSFFSAANGGISPFSMINPADIERIDILKDADATSIYGSRGANGVVLITTKKGRAGKTEVRASIYQGTGKVGHFIPMLNLQQYLAMRREAFANSNTTPTASNAPDLLVWDTTKSTDWQKALIGGTAHTTDAEATVSGGAGGTRFLFNAGYHRESTVFPGNNEDKRLSARLNADHTSQDNKFNISVSAAYSNDISNMPASDYTQMYNLPPNLPLYNSDGTVYWNNAFSKVPASEYKRTTDATTGNLIGEMSLRYTILPGLNVKANLGYTKTDLDQHYSNPGSSDNPSTYDPGGFSGQNSFAYFVTNRMSNYIAEPTIDYSIKLGNGKLTALAGGSWQYNKNTTTNVVGYNYSVEALLGSLAAAGNWKTNYQNIAEYRYEAVFGRLNYDWKGKYIINGTFRRDGSSRFGPNNRFGNFGSGGAAWVFSEESFVRDNVPFLSFGKLRASVGTTGNDQIPNYLYLGLYNPSTPMLTQATLNPQATLKNSNIHWETNTKYEVGLDLGFLHDRILLSADYYQSRSGNQITLMSVPSQAGVNAITDNFPALIVNKGMEFDLRTTNVKTKNFEWNSSFNITFYNNKLLKYPGLDKSFYATTYIVGKPVTVQQLYHYLGVDPTTGVAKYEDQNGDGSISYTYDRIPMLQGNPYYGGFSNTITYGNFQLDVMLQFHHRRGKTNLFPSTNPVGNMINQNTSVLNHWQKPGDDALYPAYRINGSDYNFTSSDFVWGDASYMKLRSAGVSYAVPQSVIKRFKMTGCMVSLRCQNLYTFTKNKYLYDTETTVTGGPTGPGNGTIAPALPPLRTITLGINCSF